MTQKMTDAVKQITAALTAIMMFLGALGYTFEKFNPTTIETFGIVLTALVPLGITLYGIWMNTFTRLQSFQDAQEKEARRLREEGLIDEFGNPVGVEEVNAKGAEDGADLK